MRPYILHAEALVRSCMISAIFLLTMNVAWAQTDAAAKATTKSTLAAADLDRGRALYGGSCDTCHTQNIHWRDKGLVTSWDTLIEQVKRWQSNTGKGWKQQEINDVAAYLNERFYRLPCPADACSEKHAAVRTAPPH